MSFNKQTTISDLAVATLLASFIFGISANFGPLENAKSISNSSIDQIDFQPFKNHQSRIGLKNNSVDPNMLISGSAGNNNNVGPSTNSGMNQGQQNSSYTVVDPDDWMNPMTIAEFVNASNIPLWNPKQEAIPLEKRRKLIPTIKEFAKVAREILDDSNKFLFAAKVMAYYSPKLSKLVLRHKFDEWRMGIEHEPGFYSMLICYLKGIIDKSKKISFKRSQVDVEALKRRQVEVVDNIELLLKKSPVLEKLNFMAMKPQNSDPVQEGAEILAKMRALGMSTLVNLIESSVNIVNKLASKDVKKEFKDMP